ncbi:hypothetical protein DSO57_1024060 [Entomophthora muscae]|uniref:Uncharacterized protein n=1 Tax=Entomophthora muscae TaxID=34485 RepID=A0ACC2S4J0_9FUNG|nr:hypothetical protein DSO57_1024060 [Entomophthora muscae]
MKTTIELCTDHIAELHNNTRKGTRLLISISGIPGSGKTTLASELIACVNSQIDGSPAIALSMDGFHLTKEKLSTFEDPEAAFARRGAPWTFDPEGLLENLRAIKERCSHVVTWPSFDHSVGDPIEGDIAIQPSHHIIIVEGNYLLLDMDPWNKVCEMFDESWFLDCSLQLSEERLVARHLRTGVGEWISLF